ncbi:uncharacterized protein LOC134712697 [Mytilus trossulus]|uniref:uncharacterized protein LOC134712697 n=1 Tax=Mytilus trossulus TaxID=6551 RepID=UPI0030077E79
MGSLLVTPSSGNRRDIQTQNNHSEREVCEDSTLEDICPKRQLYSTNNYYQYYTGQLGPNHFFHLYTELCGISIYGEECDLEWNLLRLYLGHGYRHIDIVTCEDFVEKTTMRYLRIGINFGEELDEMDFRTEVEKKRLEEFGKIGSKLLKYPSHGQQLFCTIKTGDMYTATFMKFPFMTEVFNQLHLSTRSTLMSTTEARLKTCKRLQNTYDASVEDFAYNLAEAGLYLTTDAVLSQCFECGGLVNIGKLDFDPWHMHAKYHPCCPFLLENKRQDYVDRIRREFKKQVVLKPRCILQFDNRWHAPDTEENNDDTDWTDSGSECSDYYSENSENEENNIDDGW